MFKYTEPDPIGIIAVTYGHATRLNVLFVDIDGVERFESRHMSEILDTKEGPVNLLHFKGYGGDYPRGIFDPESYIDYKGHLGE